MPSTSPKFLNFNQQRPSKKVIKTFFIEMLELPNFSRMTTSIIYFESYDKTLLVTSQTGIMTS